MHFLLSLSGCSMGSLETCTHVIPIPESYTHFLPPNATPTHRQGNKNVVISGMCRLKGDINVVISSTLHMARDLTFAYCVKLQAMLLVNLSPTPMEHRSWGLCRFKIKRSHEPAKPNPHYLVLVAFCG